MNIIIYITIYLPTYLFILVFMFIYTLAYVASGLVCLYYIHYIHTKINIYTISYALYIRQRIRGLTRQTLCKESGKMVPTVIVIKHML